MGTALVDPGLGPGATIAGTLSEFEQGRLAANAVDFAVPTIAIERASDRIGRLAQSRPVIRPDIGPGGRR